MKRNIMENNDMPNEQTNLLAKCSRRPSSPSSSIIAENLLAENNLPPNEFQCQWQKIRFYLVEPVVFLLVFAYNLSATVLKNKIIFQTCTVVFAYNRTDCQQLSNKNISEYIKSIEEDVQPYVARLFMTTTLVESIVPAIFGLFAGAWSDKYGRKPLLIASFSGYFLFYAVTSVISHLSDSVDINPWYYLFASLLVSFLGDGITYSIGTLSYISDVSTAKERTYRMVFYEALIYIGLMAGSFSSGYLYKNYSSSSLIFSISTICLLFAILIIIFVIPESLNATTNSRLSTNEGTVENVPINGDQETRNIFSKQSLIDMYRTCFQHREYEARSVILLIISTLIICIFVVDGSVSVFYLFVRDKFQWTVKEFTIFEGFSILMPIFGNVFGILLLRKIFRLKLINLAILGLLSNASNYLIRAFAAVSWELYLAILLGVLKSIVNPVLRSALSNLVPANEIGKIFSFISALGSVAPLIASPLYTVVYSATLQSFPGFFNILSANLFLIAIGLLLVVLRKKQKYSTYYNVILN